MKITKRQLRRIIREVIVRKSILLEKKKGLWDNIRAKKARGEKSDPRSKEYQAAKKAGEELNKESEGLDEAEYQGRKVTLNKPTKGDTRKSKVYVNSGKKNKDGTIKVKKVEFGDPDMRIKKSNPERRKSFRARHKCDQKKDKTTAGYWSCKAW